MANLRQIALNGNAGAFVSIFATCATRKWDAMEDEAAATTGLQVQTQLDNFTTTNTFSFGSEPIAVPDPMRYPALGRVQGFPAAGVVGTFNSVPAALLAKMRSNAAGGTTVRFNEWE